ncbi:acylneuraminate cytidylyltransferase family protein [Campylobacter lari]|uniref:Acylneuraminate cytidylyltransferase family protein n=2 Tax=Campylobacter lari TaxID=201 RepID=A0A825SHH9_CAMLA|nr:acylneuraminate cytidylyltransferase family protein [Campylobacter lari]EAH6293257.1 acylneuraminate cytidylyltransferase family protein [Campylobacter lari]EAI1582154.1 acylneuraminate cytidylyltransferase family protein [Campylobacter lari]EAI4483620.1 acylneuraminate cytidylyltransferase family protein [Campylobacter lari]EAI6154688.1 acylneuraminate cytidylyltransferase family protein [Campylobacter lari]EAI7869932.1 acylneuraminate cytidylyltransferase family protein [Campylobacter lar
MQIIKNSLNDILAIIPARSGSKRLIHKNIKILKNKPLIAWSIEAALKSKYIKNVIVSTDSKEYARIAMQYGAQVPYLRDRSLSDDTSSSFDVIKNIIDFYADKNISFKYIVLLQPTSPLRNNKHIDEALDLFFKKKANSVISVCECEHSPLWSNIIPENGAMDLFLPSEIKNLRSQDLEKYYRLNGAIYIAKIEEFMQYKGFFMPNSFAYKMESIYSIDIDTDYDFKIADLLLKNGYV